MGPLTTVAQFLQAYGGWGVAIILGVVIRYLYVDFKKVVREKDEIIMDQNKEHHEEIVAVVRECTGILTTVTEVLSQFQQ